MNLENILPSSRSEPVTPHNSNTFAVPKGIYVGVSGDIVGRLDGDTADRTFKAVPVGVWPLRFKLIKATGTTATDILALY